jgi:hypothetical protein
MIVLHVDTEVSKWLLYVNTNLADISDDNSTELAV